MKKIKNISALIILSAFLYLISCDSPTDSSIFKTNEVGFNEINQTPGFVWFIPRYNIYQSDTVIINKIKALIKPEHNFYFFAQPTCECENHQDIFPYSVKVLHSIGLNDEKCKFVVLKDINADHPYSNIVKLKDLPEIFLVKNGISVYSIGDTIKIRKNDTSLEKSKALVEQVILEAIQANQ